jgi:hypothetical protein
MFREREKSFDNSMVQSSERKSCHSDHRFQSRLLATQAAVTVLQRRKTPLASVVRLGTHKANMRERPVNVRYWDNSGHHPEAPCSENSHPAMISILAGRIPCSPAKFSLFCRNNSLFC